MNVVACLCYFDSSARPSPRGEAAGIFGGSRNDACVNAGSSSPQKFRGEAGMPASVRGAGAAQFYSRGKVGGCLDCTEEGGGGAGRAARRCTA